MIDPPSRTATPTARFPELSGLTDRDVLSVLHRAGIEVDSIEKPDAGFSNSVHKVRVGPEVLFLRILVPTRLALYRELDRLCRRRAIPAPRIADSGHDATLGVSFVMQTTVPGKQLFYFDDNRAALRHAGAVLRQIHEVTLPGFGILGCDEGGLKGTQRSWSRYLAKKVSERKTRHLLDQGFITPVEADSLLAFVSDADRFAGMTGRLLHNDFHRGHLFGEGDRITGVLDWDRAVSGDPLYDLAVSDHFLREKFPFLMEGYGEMPAPDLFHVYRVCVAFEKLFWAHSEGKFDHRPKLADLHKLRPFFSAPQG